MSQKLLIKFLVLAMLVFSNVVNTSLFTHYPQLINKIPHIKLAQLPTPIMYAQHLSVELQRHIFIKRDDLTGLSGNYGGNKVRKLEFLLADALAQGATKIVTYGCFGSNHGLATAWYAHQLGLDCALMFKPQPNSPVVRQNLLLDLYVGAEIKLFANDLERDTARIALLQQQPHAYFFPTGGSVPRGALGFVQAAFELKDQIEQGVMPQPDYIYMPTGSFGTVAGLLLGFKLANVTSKIVAVTVEPEELPNQFLDVIKKLFTQTNLLLHQFDATIPIVEFPAELLCMNYALCGKEYGGYLPQAAQAIELMHQCEKITLEWTYSGKALAALVADIRSGMRNKNEIILLWNTYCGFDFSDLTSQVDYKQLDPALYSYFTS